MAALRQCKRAPSLALLVLVQSVAVVTAFTNSFDAYPVNSQACMYQASSSSNCEGSNVTAMNECLCSNGGGFVINAASCIGTSDNTDLEAVYSVLADACAFSDTPLTISQREFMAAGTGKLSSTTATTTTTSSSSSSSSSATTTLTSASSTASPSTSATAITSVSGGQTVTVLNTGATPTSTGGGNGNNDPNDLSGTSKIGIISGAAVAGVAIISALIFFIIRTRRKKQSSDEHHPMLSRPAMGPNPSGTELSQYAGHPGHPGYAGSTYDYKAHDGAFGDPRWASTPTDAYPTAPSPAFYPGQQYHPPPLQQAPVFELSSEPPRTVIAEMPSTPMDRYSYPSSTQTESLHQQCGPSDYKQPAK